MMASIRSANTKPEVSVRRMLHQMGFRFRLHRRDLPGRPDVVLPKYKLALFVHGCFWHRHPQCSLAAVPKANAEFWQQKFEANVRRDAMNLAHLRQAGWRTVVVWECAIRASPSFVKSALKRAIHSKKHFLHISNPKRRKSRGAGVLS